MSHAIDKHVDRIILGFSDEEIVEYLSNTPGGRGTETAAAEIVRRLQAASRWCVTTCPGSGVPCSEDGSCDRCARPDVRGEWIRIKHDPKHFVAFPSFGYYRAKTHVAEIRAAKDGS